MNAPLKSINDQTLRPLVLVALVCLAIIYYHYQSTSDITPEDYAQIAHNADHLVVKEPQNRIYINLMLFMQASVGLAFILVPLVIVTYRNRAVWRRLNRRGQLFQDRQNSKIVIQNTGSEVSEDEFYKKLLSHHPNLTSYDLALCSLLRQNYSSKEIAENLNITPGSVNTARYRLRRKLDLNKNVDLTIYLTKLA